MLLCILGIEKFFSCFEKFNFNDKIILVVRKRGLLTTKVKLKAIFSGLGAQSVLPLDWAEEILYDDESDLSLTGDLANDTEILNVEM